MSEHTDTPECTHPNRPIPFPGEDTQFTKHTNGRLEEGEVVNTKIKLTSTLERSGKRIQF